MRYFFAVFSGITGLIWMYDLELKSGILFALCVFLSIFECLDKIIENQQKNEL